LFLDPMGGGAWPFLVGGVICLVNSVNERDLDLLNSNRWTPTETWRGPFGEEYSLFLSEDHVTWETTGIHFLEGLSVLKQTEVRGNNRSVMPLDVLGRTRATLTSSTSATPRPDGPGNLRKARRDGDRSLQLLIFNEEFLVSASQQLAS